jgi:hypothetical protein
VPEVLSIARHLAEVEPAVAQRRLLPPELIEDLELLVERMGTIER